MVDCLDDGRRLAVADENYLGRPTAGTVEAVFGDLPDDCDLSGEASAFSTEKARAEFGWTPDHSWRTAETEDVLGSSFL